MPSKTAKRDIQCFQVGLSGLGETQLFLNHEEKFNKMKTPICAHVSTL